MNFGLCSPFEGDRVGFARLSLSSTVSTPDAVEATESQTLTVWPLLSDGSYGVMRCYLVST